MNILILACLALAGLPIAAPATQAPDASGKWDLVVPTRQGEQNFLLSLTKAGEKLTGTVSSSEGQATGEGTQKDAAISMTFSYESDRGPRSVTLTGTQDGDAMKGTVVLAPGQAPVEWSAKRTADK